MAAKKPGLTLDQHRILGCVLQNVQEILTAVGCITYSAYGKSDPLNTIAKAQALEMTQYRELLDIIALTKYNKDLQYGVHIYFRNGDSDCPPSDDVLVIKELLRDVQLGRNGAK